jgi:hypothetical protein
VTPAGHSHAHPSGASEAGSVMLDIGGAVGAGIVYTGPGLDGVEIEIRPAGGRWDGTHTAVRLRRLPAGSAYAGVFESLPAGDYQLRLRHRPGPGQPVALAIRGGSVTEARWP